MAYSSVAAAQRPAIRYRLWLTELDIEPIKRLANTLPTLVGRARYMTYQVVNKYLHKEYRTDLTGEERAGKAR